MSTLVKVARFHLVQPFQYLAMTWIIVALGLAFSVAVDAMHASGHPVGAVVNGSAPDRVRYTGALAGFFVFFLVIGVQSIGRSLPFGLALGVSRRSYYLGTALFAAVLACADGLVVAALQAVERATGGWGVRLGFFRMPYLLNGPWYQTWLTLFVGLTLLFVYGMWFGIVYRRWSVIGTVAFIAAQVAALVAAVALVTLVHGWTGVGHFFTGLTISGLTGLLAVLALALIVGGRATIRRATV